MELFPKIFFLLVLSVNFKINSAEDGLITVLEQKFLNKFSESTNYAAKWLEDFNDRNLGNSELGKMLRYDVLKPKFGTTTLEGKGMKKMSMALIPLLFHVGATSTWMILTSIMAAKSVAIGLALLIFKIAVSSAKVASFFTQMKMKSTHGGHHEYAWSPPSHYEHRGHGRSVSDLVGSYYPSAWGSYSPEEHDTSGAKSYKTIPFHESPYQQPEHKNEMTKGPIGHS